MFIFKFDPKYTFLFQFAKLLHYNYIYPLEIRRWAVKNPTKGSLDDSWLGLQHFWSPKLIEAMHNGVKLGQTNDEGVTGVNISLQNQVGSPLTSSSFPVFLTHQNVDRNNTYFDR